MTLKAELISNGDSQKIFETIFIPEDDTEISLGSTRLMKLASPILTRFSSERTEANFQLSKHSKCSSYINGTWYHGRITVSDPDEFVDLYTLKLLEKNQHLRFTFLENQP